MVSTAARARSLIGRALRAGVFRTGLALAAGGLAVIGGAEPVNGAEPVPLDEGEEPTCGRPGLPPCPLQQWMRQKLAKSLAANDLPSVAKRFDGLAKLAPDPSWTSWATFAADGAAAARDGDVAAARKACSSCHSAWRKKYRAEHRTRPVPGG